jgi:magnesium transporter
MPSMSENGDAPGSTKGLLRVAVEHATERVPVARRDELAGELRDRLIGRDFDSVEDVVVLHGETVIGLIPVERLLAADASAQVAQVMDTDPLTVAPGTDQAVVARKMCERHESSLPVVDAEGRFRGLIPPYRMLSVLLDEHDEDLARIGGYLAGTGRARGAAEERVARRLWRRLPWLLVGLAGAMASALIVGAFEDQLDRKVLLAFFVPAVVYMADAVGTQTETVLIRGLSAGLDMRAVVRRELLTGIVIGLVVGAAFFPFALVGWGDASVAVAVALALVASCSIATGVAMLLPWIFQRLGTDPAFGSGPLATIMQDLLSIAVYLAIAIPIAS